MKTYLSNFDDLEELIKQKEITGIYLILGNGRGPQYKSMEQVTRSLRPVIKEIHEYHDGKWLAVYCGLPYFQDCPDIASCMLAIHDMFNPYILSVQTRREKDDFVDFVYRWNFLAVLSTYIGPWFLDHLVYGVVNIDSVGPIGDMELETAREAGLRIINVAPAEAARDPTKSYGLEGEVGYEV